MEEEREEGEMEKSADKGGDLHLIIHLWRTSTHCSMNSIKYLLSFLKK